MHDNDDLPPVWKPEPIKLVEVTEPDDEDDLQEMLAAIRAAKDPETELMTDDPEAGSDK